MAEKQWQQQPHEELIEDFIELSEGLAESSDMCDVVFPRENQEEIIALLTEDSSGHETVEGTQEPIIQSIPIKLNPSATAQATYNPLSVAPSTDQVYILPTPTPPAPKAKSNPSLPAMQNSKRLVALCTEFFHYIKDTSNCLHCMAQRLVRVPVRIWSIRTLAFLSSTGSSSLLGYAGSSCSSFKSTDVYTTTRVRWSHSLP